VEQWLHTGETRAGGGWGLTRRRERGVEQPSARRGGAFPAEDTTWRKALLRLVGVPYSGNVEAVLRPVSSEKEMMGSSSSAAWQHDAQAAQQQWEERLTGGAAKFLIFDEFLDCIKSLKKKKINHTSRIPKLGNFLVEIEGIKMNNFSHCLDYKFGIEFELKFLEPNQF
jgi:hypothetical protein